MTGRPARLARRRMRGTRARAEGRCAEILAAFWLMARGYRVVAFRLRLQGVEVDLVVRRRAVLAIVEVKRRATLQAALDAVGPVQQARLLRAGEALADRAAGRGPRPNVRLDLLALAPGRLPCHAPDAWRGGAGERGVWR